LEVKYAAGQPYVGAIVRMYPGPGGNRGAFVAWDPATGKKRWEIKENLAAYGGALTTAGGVVFYGTMEGWLKAVDQRTGRELWRDGARAPSCHTQRPRRKGGTAKRFAATIKPLPPLRNRGPRVGPVA